ncbi:hypothetical protein [Rhodanobacter sp. MP7CTX1]|uniref:hypothetical protein n=1 Tax=Rhodanobacter sp. MP7CTX1 TaxID=2723084 RepID=UPI00161A283A|nr:hypothetical protein [Rhodanobacter sp. MP7CTX1]MBB6186363.1 hypothetical protein [Rhodanobacter sp. MP7CTX1]
MNLPAAGTAPAIVYRQRIRERPRERGLRVAAAIGSLFVHLFFLFAFVLGPAYQPVLLPAAKARFLQVRMIEAPKPPPPPRGTPPKELGPRHQGHAGQVASINASTASMPTSPMALPMPSAQPLPAVTLAATQPVTPKTKPVAAPKPPASVPRPAPTKQLQPIPLAGEPPTVAVTTPSLQPPIPPKFQPELVRKPQLEGTRPLPSTPSLTMPEVPTQTPPTITASSIVLNELVPKSSAPASVAPARPQIPAAPPVPELQPIPLPALPSPAVNLQTQLNPPTPSVPRELPQVQAPAIRVADAQPAEAQSAEKPLEPVPLAPAEVPKVQLQAPAVKIANADKLPAPAIQPSVARPELNAPSTVATATAPTTEPANTSKPAESSESTPAQSPATATNPGEANAMHDVSTAPNATPEGSESGTPGEPNGVAAAPENVGNHANGPQPAAGQGNNQGVGEKTQGAGQPGGNQAGAAQGEKQGVPGSYIQLKPHGDTEIMNHGTPNIGYKPTRFEQDWTPEGESSIDTALRHAVEKTTLSHTFHLPRGVRIECKLMPLLPIALFGCGNPDPPATPLASKIYNRLNLPPANPLVPPVPAASTAVPAVAAVKLDNSVQCADARVAGGPIPPGCGGASPGSPLNKPAPSSSSWVPASDQFH